MRRCACDHAQHSSSADVLVQTAAAHVLRMLATRLDGVPYCVIGHSVGTWIAYEMLALAREQGLPMPLKVRQQAADVSLWLRSAFKYSVTQVFFSCFPPPDIAMSERPWKVRITAHIPSAFVACMLT